MTQKSREPKPDKKASRRSRRNLKPAESIHDYWESLPLKYRHLIVLLFLFIAPSFLFSEVYFGGRQFVAHDIEQFRATAQSVIEYREETGENALWATNIFSGMPSYTVIGTKAVYHIDTLLRRTFNSLFIPVFPFMICAGGVYFFFWLMGYRPLPSALAALAITLTTYIPIIVGAGHNSKLIAYSFIPWVMAGYWMLSRSDRKLAGLFLFAIALNFTLRAEHVQVLYYFLFVLLIWFVYDGFTAWKEQVWPAWLRRASLMVLGGLLALAANIQPYWSLYEYSAHSIRGGSEMRSEMAGRDGLDVDYAFAWSQGRGELLTLIIPASYGGSSAEGTYWGPKSFTSGPHYLGAIVFLMFLVGLMRAPGRLKYVFLGSGGLALLFSLGENLYRFNYLAFQYLPFFDKFRTPEMWLIVTVFSFAVIAAMGMKWFHDSWKDGSLTLKQLYLPAGTALVIALFFTAFSGTILNFEKPGEHRQLAQQVASQQNVSPDDPQVRQFVNRYIDQEIKPERREMAASDSRRLLLYLVLASGLLAATARFNLPANYALAGLVLLTAVDLVQVGGRYADKSGLVPSDMSAYDVINNKVRSVDRFIEENKQVDQAWPWRTLPLSDNPFNNAVPAAFVYPSIGGYSGAKLSIYQDVLDHALYTGQAGLNTELLNMLNTRFLIFSNPISLPGWEVAYEGREGVVMENRNALPKAWFVDELLTEDRPEDVMAQLNRFDASSTAILLADGRSGADAVPDITPIDNRSAEVTEYGPRQIRLHVETDAPSFLVMSEIYYPAGWYATLNDEPVTIRRTNYILRGFEIPPGQHELELRFEPRSHILGSRLSWVFNIAILLIGVAALGLWYRKS
ncbi:YfhO family protein [Balneolales bacterium ANBcel1]|nr:YfhO family protein [Balneolales bacterium ANBcel1]